MSRNDEGTRQFEPGRKTPVRDIKEPVSDDAAFPFLRPAVEEDEIGRLGDYRVLRLLGSGGMGMVFLAQDIALHRPVALKVMKPGLNHGEAAWKRFLREARSMAAIKHDNLVTVYQVGQDGDAIFLAMELLEGESLQNWIDRVAQADVADVLRFGRDIAAGLAEIHERGFVHRDIKPANIWIENPSRRIKILDFGLARAVDDTSITKSGVIVGTPAYMSPEQARGQKADFRSDLFSLGSVLYALCTGREPFNAENTMAQLAALMVDTPAPIEESNPDIPESLADLIMELLAKNPDDRPRSAAAVVERLRKIKRAITGRRRRKPASGPTQRLRRSDVRKAAPPSFVQRHRKALLIGLIALAFVVVVGALVALLRPPGPRFENDNNQFVAAGDKAYLKELPALDRINWPWSPLGKNDDKFDKKGKGPLKAIDFISMQGRPSPNGIFMHPERPGGPVVRIRYDLSGRFRSFRSIVGVNDSSPGVAAPIIFLVFGDGNELWRSKPIDRTDDTDECTISVAGVQELKLQVESPGPEPHGCHGVWFEPHLLK